MRDVFSTSPSVQQQAVRQLQTLNANAFVICGLDGATGFWNPMTTLPISRSLRTAAKTIRGTSRSEKDITAHASNRVIIVRPKFACCIAPNGRVEPKAVEPLTLACHAAPGGARPASTVRKHPGSRALLPRSQSRTVGHGLTAPEPPQVEAEALCAPTGRRLPRCGAPRRDHRAGPVRTPTVTPCAATAFDPQESGARRTRASKFWRAPGSIGLTR